MESFNVDSSIIKENLNESGAVKDESVTDIETEAEHSVDDINCLVDNDDFSEFNVENYYKNQGAKTAPNEICDVLHQNDVIGDFEDEDNQVDDVTVGKFTAKIDVSDEDLAESSDVITEKDHLNDTMTDGCHINDLKTEDFRVSVDVIIKDDLDISPEMCDDYQQMNLAHNLPLSASGYVDDKIDVSDTLIMKQCIADLLPIDEDETKVLNRQDVASDSNKPSNLETFADAIGLTPTKHDEGGALTSNTTENKSRRLSAMSSNSSVTDAAIISHSLSTEDNTQVSEVTLSHLTSDTAAAVPPEATISDWCPDKDTDNCAAPASPCNTDTEDISMIETPIVEAPADETSTIRVTTTTLTSQETEILFTAAKKWNWLLTSFTSSTITHVIVKPIGDKKRAVQRTLKFIMGVAAGAWVVSFQWVVDSLAKDELLPEIFYEISCCFHGDKWSNSCSPLRSRLSNTRLLDGWHINLEGRELASQASIKKLITLAGGCVERRNCACSDAKVVNIVDIDDNLLELEYYRDKTKTSQVVVIEWLFDCLTEYKILDTSPYTPKALLKMRQQRKIDQQTRTPAATTSNYYNSSKKHEKTTKKHNHTKQALREQQTTLTDLATAFTSGVKDSRTAEMRHRVRFRFEDKEGYYDDNKRLNDSHKTILRCQKHKPNNETALHPCVSSEKSEKQQQQQQNQEEHKEDVEIITPRQTTKQIEANEGESASKAEYEIQQKKLRQAHREEQQLGLHGKKQQEQVCKTVAQQLCDRKAQVEQKQKLTGSPKSNHRKLKCDINQQVLVASDNGLQLLKASRQLVQSTQKSNNNKDDPNSNKSKEGKEKSKKSHTKQQKAKQSTDKTSDKKQNADKRKTKHYCKFCGDNTTTICRHLQEHHSTESQVARLLVLKKGSLKRMRHLQKIVEEGDKMHRYDSNSKTSSSRSHHHQPEEAAAAAASTRPKITLLNNVWSNDLELCTFCQRYYTPADLQSHVKRCFLKPKDPSSKQQKQSAGVPLAVSPEALTGLQKLLDGSNNNEELQTYLQDELVAKFGSLLCAKYCNRHPNREPLVRMKILELGRLVSRLKVANERSLAEYIQPKMFLDIFRAVGQLGGYNEESKKYTNKALTMKLCHTLKTCASIVQSDATLLGNERHENEAAEFVRMCERQWGFGGNLTPAGFHHPSIFGDHEALLLLPLMEALNKFKFHLDEHAEECLQVLQRENTKKGTSEYQDEDAMSAYSNLSQITLCQTALFNLNHFNPESSPPRSLLFADYLHGRSCEQKSLTSLSNIEQLLSAVVCTIEMRVNNKDKETLPVLFNSKLKVTIDTLLTQRGEAGVSNDNIFLFTRPGSSRSYRIGQCLMRWAERCFRTDQSQFATALKRKSLHKHMATMWQVLNLNPDELNLLAISLVESNSLPRGALHALSDSVQAAKVVRLFTAINKGQLTQFNASRLDDIPVDDVELSEDEATDFDESLMTSPLLDSTVPSPSHITAEKVKPARGKKQENVTNDKNPQTCSITAGNTPSSPCHKRRPKDPPGTYLLERKTTKTAEANAKKKQKQKRRNQKDSDFIPPKKRRCEPEIPPVIARSTGEASEPTTAAARCTRSSLHWKPVIHLVEDKTKSKTRAKKEITSKDASGSKGKHLLLTEKQKAAILDCFGSEIRNGANWRNVRKQAVEDAQSRVPALQALSWRDIRHYLKHYIVSIKKFGHN